MDLVLVSAIDTECYAPRGIFESGYTRIPVELEPVRHIGVYRCAAVVAGGRLTSLERAAILHLQTL